MILPFVGITSFSPCLEWQVGQGRRNAVPVTVPPLVEHSMDTVPASSVPCKATSRWVVSMPEELGTDVFYEYGGASGNIDVHAVVGDMEPLAIVQGGKSVAKDGGEELAEGVEGVRQRHRLETIQQVCWFMLITFSFSLRLSYTRLHLGHRVEGHGEH